MKTVPGHLDGADNVLDVEAVYALSYHVRYDPRIVLNLHATMSGSGIAQRKHWIEQMRATPLLVNTAYGKDKLPGRQFGSRCRHST
eukprot:2592048-Rhodomonas_salina.8